MVFATNPETSVAVSFFLAHQRYTKVHQGIVLLHLREPGPLTPCFERMKGSMKGGEIQHCAISIDMRFDTVFAQYSDAIATHVSHLLFVRTTRQPIPITKDVKRWHALYVRVCPFLHDFFQGISLAFSR